MIEKKYYVFIWLLLFSSGSVSKTLNKATLAIPGAHELQSYIANEGLKIATWNMEHFAYPANDGCKPRKSHEIQAIMQYINTIDADIFAVQEVASTKALSQVFPSSKWQLIMSTRLNGDSYECRGNGFSSTQQKVAFAIKKAVEIKRVVNLKALALGNNNLRYGLEVTVDSSYGEIDLLNVHMKSGCFEDDFSEVDSPACMVFAKQVPIIGAWIAEKSAKSKHYIVLGDFNHRLSAPYNRLTRLVSEIDPNSMITTRHIIGCHPRYPAPIDHIITGGFKTDSESISHSAKVHYFGIVDPTEQNMLSDHCAISIEI